MNTIKIVLPGARRWEGEVLFGWGKPCVDARPVPAGVDSVPPAGSSQTAFSPCKQ